MKSRKLEQEEKKGNGVIHCALSYFLFSSKEWNGIDPSVRARLHNCHEDGEFWCSISV